MPSPSYSVSATNYGRNPSDAYYALAGTTGGGIPPGPVEITGDLTVDGNATFKQAVTCEAALTVQGAGTFDGAVTAPSIIAATALGSQGALTVAGNVTIQNASGINMQGGTIAGSASVQSDEIFTNGPVKFGRLATVYLGSPSAPVTEGGQLGEAGVLQLTWVPANNAYEGSFVAPNGVTNNPTFLTPVSASIANTCPNCPVFSFAAVPPNIIFSMSVSVTGPQGTLGNTLRYSYLFIHMQATPS